jgi:hypothetical protein
MNDPTPSPVPLKVTVVDVKMPFWSMVNLMVQCVLASIPALLILAFITFGLVALVVALGRGCGTLLPKAATLFPTPTPVPTRSFQ